MGQLPKIVCWGSLFSLLALGASEPVAQASAAKTIQRYVLIIANNHSLDKGVRPLRFADDDAARYYQLFELTAAKTALFTVFDDDTARLYPKLSRRASPPRAKAIFDTLKRWNAEMVAHKEAGRSTELFFIYAGHGDRDEAGEGYVNLQDRKLRRRDLYQQVLAPSKAGYIHLIIDACKSYFLVNRRGGGDEAQDDSHEAEIRAFLRREELSAYPNAGVILATSGDHSTHEWTRYRGGILSHELRSAIAGAADINGDGRIEYSEVHAFAAAANARLRHPEARLRIFTRPPRADRRRPLMDLRQARRARLLRFGQRLSGRFHVEDDRGVRIADLNKAAGVRFDLAVDRRRTYYLRRKSGEARVAPGSSRVLVAALSFSPAALAPRSASLDRSFRKDLYNVAFSRGFYEGFCAQTGHVQVGGKAADYVIHRADEVKGRYSRHQLLVGYMTTSALFDLDGVSHGLQARYGFAVHPNVLVGATFEFGRSSHAADGTDETFRLDRIAALVTAAARARLWSSLVGRAEINLGYQGLFSAGQKVIKKNTNPIQGNDALGFRFEAGLGLRVDLQSLLFLDVRGGIGVDRVTIEPDEHTNIAPYFAAGLGLRL